MNITRCNNGHYYDVDVYSTCPECENGGAVNAAAPADYGETIPMGGGFVDDTSKTMPAAEGFQPDFGGFVDDTGSKTMPATAGYQPEFTPQGGVDDYDGATQAVNINKVAGFTPVAGWLVCIEGPARGTDYRIKPGYNYIGREERMDICLRGDDKISGYRDSVIGYDDDTKTFYFGHQNGKNPVKVNGKLVINQVELKEYDIIMIGSTKLIFVPLCGEKFDWNTIR